MRQLTSILLLLTFVGCSSSLTNNPQGTQDSFSALSSTNMLSSTQIPNDPLYSQQDYLNTVNISDAWQTSTGNSSQEIAIISMGGVNNNHEDLQSRVTIETSEVNNGAANPIAGIIGAATNNGKGIAGVNWNSPISSYDIGTRTTKTVLELESNVQVNKSFVDLDGSAIAPAINNATQSGAKTIYLPLNWIQDDKFPNLVVEEFQFFPCCKIDKLQFIFTNVKNIINSIIAANKADNNYKSAISAVKNAYQNEAVIVGKALEYNGTGIGFPANLASDHLVFTVGAADLSGESFQYSSIPEGDNISDDPKDINVIAPGVDLQTTLPGGNDEYGTVSGTGASAALATGIISLLQSADPSLTPDDITHILEKTAAPVGGGGYDEQSGYGLIDAGAAMDYVQSHDIKHGITTDGQVEQIFSDRLMTFVSSAWEEVASGAYYVDEYEVTYTIPLIPSADNDLWFNAKGTYGWTPANPNDQNRYAKVELSNDHATVTTYIYHLYDTAGNEVGWHPTSPGNLQLSYSYVGEIPPEPLRVSIHGAGYVNDGHTMNFTASVYSGADGSIDYQWYFRQESYSSWTPVGNNSATYGRTFYSAPGGRTAHSAVKVRVRSGGATATDVHSVDVYGCPNSGGHSVGTNDIIPCDN